MFELGEARMHVEDCECLDATSMGGPVVTDPRCTALDGGPELVQHQGSKGSWRLEELAQDT